MDRVARKQTDPLPIDSRLSLALQPKTVPDLHLFHARSFFQRLLGLHGRPYLSKNTGLWLSPCRAIHTVGLSYAIDLVFLDWQGNIVRTVQGVSGWRMVWCWQAYSVVELPEGYLQRHPRYAEAIRQALAPASDRQC